MTLRVTGGTLKGRKLAAPRGDRVRPTSSRVRESLFSILGGQVRGACTLDLFAGAGSLGIEAASRGAARVVFVESDPAHVRLLRKNIALLEGVAEADVLRLDARSAPKRLTARGERFDLVFLDPPYAKGLATPVLEALGRGLLVEDAVVVVETSSAESLPSRVGPLLRDDERRYGGTTLSFYRGDHAPVGEA